MNGAGVDEVGVDRASGKTIVAVNPRYYRPTEVDTLLGDASKARDILNWHPKITFSELVASMVKEDLEEARRDSMCAEKGFKTFNHHE